jgi:hypothetical protein
MKRSIFIQLWLTGLLCALAGLSNAQTVAGSWKKTDEVLMKANGKASSTFKMMLRNMPCFGNIVYIFSNDGKMDEQAKGCSVELQKQIAGQLQSASWKMNGGKLLIDVADKAALAKHAEYQVEFIGKDKMIWTFNYADNPGVPNVTRAKQIQTTYVRL